MHCDTVMPTKRRWSHMRPYLRILFIMMMSSIVVIIIMMAVVDAETPMAENDSMFLLLFALMVVATVFAARLMRSR